MDAGKDTVGQFTVVGALPAGPYGSVWRAHESSSGREVVLRQLALATEEAKEQIVAHAMKLRGVKHPNVAHTFDPVSDVSGVWLVEDWVEGASLTEMSAAGVALSVKQSLGVLHGALEGLAAAHRVGVVHGNVSARTVMVSTEGTPRLVEFGAWQGQPEVAGVGVFSSPEAFAGEPLTAASDVYSAGAMFARALVSEGPGAWSLTDAVSLDGVDSDVRSVLARALSTDSADRQPNGQVLLDELDRAARRVFGAVWWTTEGLGAAVASGVAASVAATATGAAGTVGAGGLGAVGGSTAAASPAGGFGAVSGSLSLRGDLGAGAMAGAMTVAGGAAALAGSTKAAAKEVRKGSRKLIGIIAGAVALVVVAVSGYALTRPQNIQAVPPAGIAAQPTVSQSPKPSPTPSPSATPKPNPAQGFSGQYRFESVVTKSNDPARPVGQKEKRTWTVKTTCVKGRCTTSILSSSGGKPPFKVDANGWSDREPYKLGCEDTVTHVPSGQKVAMLYTRSLKVTQRSGELITKMTGGDRDRQMEKCSHQVAKRRDVRKKFTLSYVGH